MSRDARPTSTNEAAAGAGAAGVGAGTLLVLIANTLPEGHWAKPFLVWAAPSLTVVSTAAWYWIQHRVIETLHTREALARINDARRLLLRQLDSSSTPEHRRAWIRAELEKLDDIEVAQVMTRVNAALWVAGRRFAPDAAIDGAAASRDSAPNESVSEASGSSTPGELRA
jgi:hypothetical protein